MTTGRRVRQWLPNRTFVLKSVQTRGLVLLHVGKRLWSPADCFPTEHVGARAVPSAWPASHRPAEREETLNWETEGSCPALPSPLWEPQPSLIKQLCHEVSPWGRVEPQDSVDNEDLSHKQRKLNGEHLPSPPWLSPPILPAWPPFHQE